MGVAVFDALIIGGGPAGCAAALALTRLNPNANVCLIDNTNPSAFKIGESLPPESASVLQFLHPSLPKWLFSDSKQHLRCIGNASAWASAQLEDKHAIMNPFGYGFHLDRAAFDEGLRDMLRDVSQGTSETPVVVQARFTRLEKDESGIWVVDANIDEKKQQFRAKWVVDATGRKASVATRLGAKTIVSDPLLAFYALFRIPSACDGDDFIADTDTRTMIEATPEGWFYTSLVNHQSMSARIVAFHTLPNHPAAKIARRREGFLSLLHSTSTHINGIISMHGYEMLPDGFPKCTAAGSSHLTKSYDPKEHWIAVGDAAMAFDPLSSQGMITALEMGGYAGAVVARHTLDGNDKDLGVEETYSSVREDYRTRRAYYYHIVQRFDTEQFWQMV